MPCMVDAGFRLGIDLGTSNTVGCLRRGDGPVTPLLFDASPLLKAAAASRLYSANIFGVPAMTAAVIFACNAPMLLRSATM